MCKQDILQSLFAPSLMVQQFFKYVVVGGLAFIVDYTTLFLLTQFTGFHYLLAATAGFLLGLVINYLLCIGWIFDQRIIENPKLEFTVFALIGVTGLGLNNGIMFVATDWGGIHYLLAKLLAAACVLIFNFLLRHHFLFLNH